MSRLFAATATPPRPRGATLRVLLLLGLAPVVAGAAGAAVAAGQGMPTFNDKKSITEAVNTDTGAVFELGHAATMTFPVGLPVGRSRLVTLKMGKRPKPSQVAPGFSPVGPTLDFSGAFRTEDKPVRVAVTTKHDPAKGKNRSVLAMEIATLCDDSNKQYKLKSGLCSGWELVDAEYRGEALVAELTSTGGLRLQFGTVPAE